MRIRERISSRPTARLLALGLAGLLWATIAPQDASAQGWQGYGRDPQHSALGEIGSQLPNTIRWSTPVDLAPQYNAGGALLTHYGSPLITRSNTVLVPVKTTAGGVFRVDARAGASGALIWSFTSDYVLPSFNWTPTFGMSLTPKDKSLVMPGNGGTVISRSFPDAAAGATSRLVFYGLANYNANPAAFNAAIKICTPITSDKLGNLYFGYVSSGAALPGYPSGIPSGLARISSAGVGTFVSAASLANDNAVTKVSYNCAPALSLDGSSVYVAVNNIGSTGRFGNGYLCRASSATLARQSSVLLRDPRNSNPGTISDDGTSSPTVGPDGDVYYGILENGFPSNNARGWMLHFNSTLATSKIAGAFGWDDTASIVPASAVPSYGGGSSYLILTKYNNYMGVGSGNGQNKLAVLDPFSSMTDPISGQTVMKEVLTVLGPSPDAEHPGGVREWCINTAAIDAVNKCAIVNNEDGKVYRWSFVTNTLSAGLQLAPPTGEAYTSTILGPDGAVYAINNANLFSCVFTQSFNLVPSFIGAK